MAKNRRLNELDKQFIRENTDKTDKEIGEILGCSNKTVERARASMGIRKPGGKLINEIFEDEIKLPLVEKVSRDIVPNKSNYSDKELSEYYRNKFITSARGQRIKKLVNAEDYEFFIEDWIGYHLLLEDVNYSEEGDIERIILLKLRMDQNQKQYKRQLDIVDKLLADNKITSVDELDINDPDQAMIYDRIHMAGVQALSLNKDNKDMSERLDAMTSNLNVTRRQREEKGRVGGDTFFSKCQEFTQKVIRQEQGRKAELLRIATDSNMDKLRHGITYLDGEVAPQLLDSETVRLMEEQNKKSKNDE